MKCSLGISSFFWRDIWFFPFYCFPLYLYIVHLRSEVKLLSRVWLFATPWTVTYQAPLSMGFSRQESWSGLPFPSPGDLPDPGIEPRSPTLQADALPSEPPSYPYFLFSWILHLFGCILPFSSCLFLLFFPQLLVKASQPKYSTTEIVFGSTCCKFYLGACAKLK